MNPTMETVEDHGVGLCLVCGDRLERGQVILRLPDGTSYHHDHHDELLQLELPLKEDALTG